MAHIANLNISRPAFAGRLPRISVRDMLALSRQRRELKDLDAHLLKDIGITAHQAKAESRRPAWDAPAHWRN